MVNLNEIARSPYSPERKFRRFSLQYPVRVKFRSGRSVAELDALSKNVSIGGLLLESTSPIPAHSLVSFVMTVEGGPVARAIHLTGEGEVVRVEPKASTAGFAIAVECKHPITQVEGYLPAVAG